MTENVPHGKAVLEALAARFPQLYVAPAEGAQQAHAQASRRGAAPQDASLSHFAMTAEDELREVDTPAGPVEVVFLKDRSDFETFLQIIGHKSQPVEISRTVGAITYRGLADWGKVRAAHEAYVADGGTDWAAEFSRLAKTPGAFRAELIAISEGPYSDIAAGETSFSEDEWLRVSKEIRLHHECAHVVCRRTMPDDILAVWDEVTADVTGIICALGRYDAELAAKFLGVTADGFVGGRLTEYLTDEQAARIDEVAAQVYGSLLEIERMCDTRAASDPFAFLLQLKRNPLIAY